MVERVDPAVAKTRFKSWWRLVGHPLELVTDVDFEALFRANDKFDEEAQGATEFIGMMVKYLGLGQKGTREFSAAEMTKLVDDRKYGVGTCPANSSKPDPGTLKSALEEASGRPFKDGNVNAHRVARKLKSIEGRPVEVDGKALHLVVESDHEGNRYRIKPLP